MNVAFIPVRGGSKSIPLKNIKPINGKPLLYWTLKAACACEYIDKIYVATDSDKIKETVKVFQNGIESKMFTKVVIIGRSAESASDTASTEFAMLEFAEKYFFNNIVLIQATSPLLASSDLDRGFDTFFEDDVDSVLSVVQEKRFHWKNNKEGYATPLNYDMFHRPRRQEFDGDFVENGAFYITSRDALIKSQNRISGNIKIVEMKEDTYWEIDEPSDWVIIEALMKKNGMSSPVEIPDIKLFLTDCDGCLTDGGMYYTEHGDESKKFNTKDGMGLSLLKKHGILTGVVTGECAELNRRRAKKLQLDYYIDGCKDKASVIKKICKENNILLKNVCYVGDDVNDLEALSIVGFPCAPTDAIPQIKEKAILVTKAKGGKGVIREIAEIILSKVTSNDLK